MAKRRTAKTEILDSQKTQEIQEKITEQLQKNTRALIKTSDDISKTIAEKTERLEELRKDFIREENHMVETRESHKASMELLEEETKEKASEILKEANDEAEEMLKNAQSEKERILCELSDKAKKANADFAFQLEQNARKEKEAFLGDRKRYYESYCEENGMAVITVDAVNTLEKKLATIVETHAETLERELVLQKMNLEKDFTLKEVTIKAEYDNKIAQFTPKIESLEKELKRAEERAAEYKSIIDANREAQVQMKQAEKPVEVHVDSNKR